MLNKSVNAYILIFTFSFSHCNITYKLQQGFENDIN